MNPLSRARKALLGRRAGGLIQRYTMVESLRRAFFASPTSSLAALPYSILRRVSSPARR